jgi:hypothetical protein
MIMAPVTSMVMSKMAAEGRTTNSTRIRVASTLNYWARPPHTPAGLRSVLLRYSLRVGFIAPPSRGVPHPG